MTSFPLEVRPLADADVSDCAAVLAQLPQWFGIEESNRTTLAELSELPSFGAFAGDRLTGFASLRVHGPGSSEIQVLAVEPRSHRRGIGRALVDRLAVEAHVRAGPGFFHVKTLAPSDPDPNYRRTRAFYAALGFAPLFESDAFWGPENPAIVLIKTLP